MKFKLQQVADMLGGILEGNPNHEVFTLSKIEEAVTGSLCFLSNPKYFSFIYHTQATAVIVDENFSLEKEVIPSLIRVKDPYASFARLLELYNEIKLPRPGISDKCSISSSAQIGNNVHIGDFAFIGENVIIGDNCKIFPQVYIGDNAVVGNNTILHPGVKIYTECKIGSYCTLHAGVVIGADGFGFALQGEGLSVKIQQIGNVVLGDHIEIGANTCIDRATMGSTRIMNGVKLDNLIQIGHNVEIGENTVIAAQSGVAGSTKIGSNCVIAGQVGIIGHLTIGKNVKVAGQSGIESNLPDNATVQGSPAFDIRRYKKSYVHFRNFKFIEERLSDIEKYIQK